MFESGHSSCRKKVWKGYGVSSKAGGMMGSGLGQKKKTLLANHEEAEHKEARRLEKRKNPSNDAELSIRFPWEGRRLKWGEKNG